ncbi:3-hydroxybutyrate dehydrogenase [Tersicoccus solisilvae]|uniref:3-hydroxybutyrate dehydrogenase n=1 Tax=Tersicoccus solisilvae TaxID=1882339 RepID=A0ABQ1PFH8_9MICC|nr:3-hydroxybutyrate dehydrogenase [Tersicoccus solisilvae]GGC96111.1 3-hydroxybutyrate dehydrogenase [Tersicoccus solisilvae]
MSTTDHPTTALAPAAAADLTGRTALVTGAASGIGAAIARALAGQGAHVIAADRDDAGAREVADATGGTPWTVDLADLDALARPPADGAIDILVNNAGIQRVSPIEEFDPADFRRIITLMLESPFMLIRAALPHMYARGWGRILNISSVHGLRASAYKSAYVAAKHGLEGLSKVTALEGGPHGVTSNCINPAYVNTPLVQHQIADQAKLHGLAENEVVEKIMLTESSIKRLVEPDEVASLALWLVSEHAGMVTGASYTMDGGWSAR